MKVADFSPRRARRSWNSILLASQEQDRQRKGDVKLIQWLHYPRSNEPTPLSLAVVEVCKTAESEISSDANTKNSDEVLAAVREDLEAAGFSVESGKKKAQKIHVPVLYGRNGKVEKSFEADAYHQDQRYVLEVEAGRAVMNNQFLKDLFQACMMREVRYLGIAVRNKYTISARTGNESKDFERVVTFFDTLYASSRLKLPLDGILLIGY